MNKLYGLLILAAGCLFMASCSKDDNEKTNQPAINVLSADTYFGAKGGEKFLELDQTPASVYAKGTWLQATSQGNKVMLTAQVNTAYQSRNTQVILKNQVGDSIFVNVSQEGFVFGMPFGTDLLLNDDATTKEYNITSNLPVTISTTADWLTATEADNKLTINAAANTTGKPRIGFIKVNAEGRKDSLRVVQATIDDIVGNYFLVARVSTPGSDPTLQRMATVISKVADDSVSVTINGRWKWGAKYTEGGKLTLRSGQDLETQTLGSGSTRYIKSIVMNTEGSGYFSTAVSIDAQLLLPDTYAFFNNGSAGDKTANFFGFGAFKTTQMSRDSWIGLIAIFADPLLIRQ